MEDDPRVEDLPDDLTPLITRTTMDHVNGGAFGDVWKCNYNADGISALVAVKAFRFSERDDLETINRNISREIGILRILRHKNIVPLWGIATGFGRMPELRCLVSPWMPNGTLTAYLTSNHNDLTVLDRSRMSTFGAVHSESVMHGDITGVTSALLRRGHARLIDFGLSTIVQPLLDQSHLARSSTRPGAIRYAAPELVVLDNARGLPVPLEKADIYSFGCIMLQIFVQGLTDQILSGRRPWSEILGETLIIITMSQGRGPQRPDGHPAIIDLDWEFIQKCLQFGPELRPSAEEVLNFVMHRFYSPDSSRPPDDPPDDTQDNFPGTSPHGSSDDSDTVEQTPDSPPLHRGRKPNPSITFEPRIQGSSNHGPPPRTMLNNQLQKMYGSSASDHVRWEIYSQGPLHALTWHATVYIDDMIYGRGTARTRGGAQDQAAMQAAGILDRDGETRAGRTGQMDVSGS
ncbi:kinase-like domain-containing protein [Suillus subluteus]|nr:kinase-like domain-containing protein [Suillus subluteus]